MTHAFHYATWQEEDWWIAQLLDFELASQGRTEAEAVANLREALRLHLRPLTATRSVPVRTFELEWAARVGRVIPNPPPLGVVNGRCPLATRPSAAG